MNSDKHRGGLGGIDDDENDSDVEMHDNTGADSDASKSKKSNGMKSGGFHSHNNGSGNGNGESVGTSSKANKSQHHTVTPQEASPLDKDNNKNHSLKREDDGTSSSSTKNHNHIQGEIKTEKNNKNNNSNTSAASAPVPLLKGILTYIDNELTRKHTITGMWNFESSTESQPQTFQLTRNLAPDEDPKELPKDGEFQGSFRLMYSHVSTNGKTKTRTRVISESGVKLAFTKQEGKEDSFDIKGKGTNQYGVFSIFGTAKRDTFEQNKAYAVELRKKYITTPDAAGGSSVSSSSSKKSKSKSKKRKLSTTPVAVVKNEGPLPDPSKSYPSGVVCLRGKASRDASVHDGVVYNISGLWSTGLDLVLSDPKNEHGFCNEFEYEHRGTVSTVSFPISGRYTGWFNYTEDGKRTRYTERDVVLKFKKNNAGYHNVEGKGTNMFGKYTISGTLDKDDVITLFRHFVPIKAKKSSHSAVPMDSVPSNGAPKDLLPRMTLDDVDVPTQASYEPIVAPLDGHYQAVSRGIFKVNEDGAHTCNGKWAQSRSHHTTNMTSNFTFGLEEHNAKQALEDMKRKGLIDIRDANDGKVFPVDSANYKGSFKIKKGTAKFTPVIDQQVVMKFRKNTSGSYNVYGKGLNVYGTFDLTGTLILHGRSSGSVELFRIYPPVQDLPPVSSQPQSHPKPKGKSLPMANKAPTKKPAVEKTSKPKVSSLPPVPVQGSIRRESSRQSKLPSHLADDDPAAQKLRLMDKCMSILKVIREKDISLGSYFLEPVDPVAHNIPTYYQIITDPMDLGTIQTKMDANEIETPEEFARLTRLVFENAVKFNTSPVNFVHQSARNLLTLFNQKFRDVERLVEKKKPTKAELKEMRRKQQKEEKEEKKRLDREKKRKREEDEDPKLKQLSLLQTSSKEVKNSLDALTSATTIGVHQSDGAVSRNEFNMMTNVVKQIQTQMSYIQELLQQMVKVENTTSTAANDTTSASTNAASGTDSVAPKKQRRQKKASKPQPKPVVPEPVVPVAPPPVSPPIPVPPIEEEPLTHEEQEELTVAINEISEDKLLTVINIIKQSQQASDLIDDDQEIELDLDQLDTATQRKLLKFVFKNKPKPKKAKKPTKKKKIASPPPAALEPEPTVEQNVSDTKAKTEDSEFKFFNADDSDSDDEEDDAPIQEDTNANADSGFNVNENTTMDEDDDDDDDTGAAPDWSNISKQAEPKEEGEEEDDDNDTGAAPDWSNISKQADPKEEGEEEDDDSDEEDDAWETARGDSAAQTERDKKQQEREEKMLQEQKIAKEKGLAEAAEKRKKLQAERKAKEEEEARKRDQKENEEKERAKQAKDALMEDIMNVDKSVDLGDNQRGIMSEYEQSIYDQDVAGGASPSSDFGF